QAVRGALGMTRILFSALTICMILFGTSSCQAQQDVIAKAFLSVKNAQTADTEAKEMEGLRDVLGKTRAGYGIVFLKSNGEELGVATIDEVPEDRLKARLDVTIKGETKQYFWEPKDYNNISILFRE
ncbi:MAG TPA: hypothetical protein VJA21_08220, partial [Verrucomicrobiae bacterium]